MNFFGLGIQTPNHRRCNIPRGSKGAMSHTLSVLTHHAPLDWKSISLFIFWERRVTSSADRSATSRRQRHAGWELSQSKEQEDGDKDQANNES